MAQTLKRASRPDVLSWAGLVGVALAVRLFVVFGLLDAMPLAADAVRYAEEARALLASFPGDAPYYWPPGLPFLLAMAYGLFGDTLTTARLFSVAVGVLNVGGIACLAYLLIGHRGSARTAGWLAALYPPAVMMSGQVYAQPLELLCLLAMCCCLLAGYRRGRWWLFGAAGLAFGYGSLVRPSLLSLTPALLVMLFMLSHAGRRPPAEAPLLPVSGGLAFSLGALFCVLPVLQYNASLGAGPVVSTNNAQNFFLGNNPYTPLYKTSYLSARPPEALPAETQAYLRRFARADGESAAMQREAWRYVVTHPFATLLRTLNRARAFWGFEYIMSRRIQAFYRLGTGPLVALLAFEAGGYAIVMVLALLGLCRTPARSRATTTWILWLVLAYMLPYMAAFATGTYHFSAVGLLFPFAGAGLCALRDRSLRPHGKRLFLLALALFCLVQVEYAWFTILYSPADVL